MRLRPAATLAALLSVPMRFDVPWAIQMPLLLGIAAMPVRSVPM